MKRIMGCIVVLILFACLSAAHGEDAGVAALFKEKGVTGTMVIASGDGSATYVHNDGRAGTRLVPASTFKVPNTLIALQEGVVANEKEIIKWDGADKGLPAWNKDQSIETAFASSCVWFYQELAKRVGKEKYSSYLKTMVYGNGEAGPDVTTFWLVGDLRISAFEQIAFLRKVYARAYPFKPSAYDVLAKVMVAEKTPAYTLRAKTGWAQRLDPMVGWYVGYVETGGMVWYFAMNMDITRPDDARLRQELTMKALKLRKVVQ